jgi:UDP-N-acetylglucosamine 1-carboxyvinyltransferase
MGGDVKGAGSDTIVVNGVKQLHGCDYNPLSDRIVGGTYLMACAFTSGDVTVQNIRPDTMRAVIEKLARSGCTITHGKNFVRLRSSGKMKAIHKIETQPFPGFPTDLQPQMVAMLTKASGCSMMVENLFESRYKYTVQLNKMGARITVKDRVAVIKGVKTLHGAPLIAEDLRGGAALVVSALGAEGESLVSGVENIDRGYYHIEKDFSILGAYINRIIL